MDDVLSGAISDVLSGAVLGGAAGEPWGEAGEEADPSHPVSASPERASAYSMAGR